MINSAAPTRTGLHRWQTIPVRAADMDARRHVNNATYLTYFEIARRPVFEEHPDFADYEARGQNPVLATQTIVYRKQLAYPATIDIGLSLAEIRTRSFTFNYGIYLNGDDDLIAHGHTTHAWYHHEAEKAVTIPQEIRDILATLKANS